MTRQVAPISALVAILLAGHVACGQSNPLGRNELNSQDEKLDQFGNPIGSNYGLAQDNQYAGRRILVWCHWAPVKRSLFPKDNPLWAALKKKGFQVRLEFRPFDPSWLSETDQLWIASGPLPSKRTPDAVRDYSPKHSYLEEPHFQAIEKFLESGRGVFLLADDTPRYEADLLARRWFGSRVLDDHRGEKIAAVRGRKLTRDLLKKFNAEYRVDDHPLLTGVNFIWEGNSVGYYEPNRLLDPALTSSAGRPLAAVSKDQNVRLVLDCGMTRYYSQYIGKSPGNIRFAQNVAAYLM